MLLQGVGVYFLSQHFQFFQAKFTLLEIAIPCPAPPLWSVSVILSTPPPLCLLNLPDCRRLAAVDAAVLNRSCAGTADSMRKTCSHSFWSLGLSGLYQVSRECLFLILIHLNDLASLGWRPRKKADAPAAQWAEAHSCLIHYRLFYFSEAVLEYFSFYRRHCKKLQSRSIAAFGGLPAPQDAGDIFSFSQATRVLSQPGGRRQHFTLAGSSSKEAQGSDFWSRTPRLTGQHHRGMHSGGHQLPLIRYGVGWTTGCHAAGSARLFRVSGF